MEISWNETYESWDGSEKQIIKTMNVDLDDRVIEKNSMVEDITFDNVGKVFESIIKSIKSLDNRISKIDTRLNQKKQESVKLEDGSYKILEPLPTETLNVLETKKETLYKEIDTLKSISLNDLLKG